MRMTCFANKITKCTNDLYTHWRKLGEMIAAAKATGQIKEGNPKFRTTIPGGDSCVSLKEIGITLKESSRAQRIAAVPKDNFEQAINNGKKAGKLSRNMFTKAPTGPPKGRRGQSTPQLDKARLIIRDRIMAGEALNCHALEKEHGISHVTFDMAITAELARKEILENPPLSRADLSPSAQAKFDRVIKQEKERLQALLAKEVDARIKELLDLTIGPRLREREKLADRIRNSYKGIMTKSQYRKIVMCLHADRAPSEAEKNDAFILFTSFEKLLLNEKESPTPTVPVPRTMAEWDALRRQAAERRKQARAERAKKTSPATNSVTPS